MNHIELGRKNEPHYRLAHAAGYRLLILSKEPEFVLNTLMINELYQDSPQAVAYFKANPSEEVFYEDARKVVHFNSETLVSAINLGDDISRIVNSPAIQTYLENVSLIRQVNILPDLKLISKETINNKKTRFYHALEFAIPDEQYFIRVNFRREPGETPIEVNSFISLPNPLFGKNHHHDFLTLVEGTIDMSEMLQQYADIFQQLQLCK